MITAHALPSPETAAALQRWIRPPAGSQPCPWSGLRRTAFNGFVRRERVRTARIGAPGSRKPAVVVWLPDLLAALDRLAEEQAPAAAPDPLPPAPDHPDA